MKHILIVSQCFYPETFRINDIALEFKKMGYKVTVLTGIPNYPEGKFYDGYSRKTKRQEKWNGIDIIRLPIVARGKNSVKLIMNYYSFVIAGKRWVRKTDLKADLVFSFETSPMMQVKVGCKYAKKFKVPHIVYVQDLWPENLIEVTGITNRLVIGPLNRMADKIYREANEILATSPSFVKAITDRKNPVPKDKVHYWPQYAEDFYKPLKKAKVEEIPDDGSIKIAFTGNIGLAQGLDVLPKTAKLLEKENIKFVIVGDGRAKESFLQSIDEEGVADKFILIPRVQPEKIPTILSACDAGFVSFSKSKLWDKTIPAKLQSYMACGKAIIASASGETERIIKEANCGICVKQGDYKELAKQIKKIKPSQYATYGKNASAYYKKHFSKKKLMSWIDGEIKKQLSRT